MHQGKHLFFNVLQQRICSIVEYFRDQFSVIPMPMLVSIFSGLLVSFFLLSAFYYGIGRNYHHIVPEAIEYQNVNLAIALTERVYKQDLGHVANTKVYDTLRENGITIYKHYLEPLGAKFPDNESDPVLINKALTAASTLTGLTEPKKIMSGLKPIEPNDLGMSEFYKISFAVFGIRVQSFYLMYFSILGFSIILYYIRHFNDPIASSFLAILVGLHFVMFIYLWEIFPPHARFGVGTVYAPRFISILGIIPALHLAIDVFRSRNFSFTPVATFILQVGMLAWILTMRGTILWGVLWVATIIGGFFVILIIARISIHSVEPIIIVNALKRLTSWPIIVFAVGIIGYNSYYIANLNPVYKFSDEFLPSHMVWHSLYSSLELHPDFNKKFGAEHMQNGKRAYGDAMPMAAAVNFLKKNYDLDTNYMISPFYGMKYRTTERIIKEVYFKFIRENPIFMLELHLIYKPLVLYNALRKNLTNTLPNIPISAYIGLLLSMILFGSTAFANEPFENDPFADEQRVNHSIVSLALIIPLGLFVSLSPVLVAFPSDSVIGDQFFMVLTTVLFFVSLLPFFITRLIRSQSYRI